MFIDAKQTIFKSAILSTKQLVKGLVRSCNIYDTTTIGRNRYGPKLLRAEIVMGRNVQSPARVTLPRVSRCLYCTKSGGDPPKPAGAANKKPKPAQQSAPKVAPVQEPPSDNTKYQCEIYLNHDPWTFYNTEAQMTARRVGQPSSKVKPTV